MADPLIELDFYRPQFEVKLGGSRLESEVLHSISDISYEDDIEGSGAFTMTLNNWDPQQRDFPASQEDQWLPGKKVEIAMGYRGNQPLTPMIRGQVSATSVSFPESGVPVLTVSGQNLMATLMNDQISADYTEKTDSEIAKAIASRLRIDLRTAPAAGEPTYSRVVQANQYDAVFLKERARLIGYDLFVEEPAQGEARLYFGPSEATHEAVYTLTYHRDLIEFHPNLDVSKQVGEVVLQSSAPDDKTEIVAKVKRADVACRGSGLKKLEQPFSRDIEPRKETVIDHQVGSQAEADAIAKGTMSRIVKGMLTGRGRCIGLPDIRAGAILELAGLGERYNGRYCVTSSTHRIGEGGYQTDFACRREDR